MFKRVLRDAFPAGGSPLIPTDETGNNTRQDANTGPTVEASHKGVDTEHGISTDEAGSFTRQGGPDEHIQVCNTGITVAMHSPAPTTGNATADGSCRFKTQKGDLAKLLCPFCIATYKTHKDNDKQKKCCGKRKRAAVEGGSTTGKQIGWHQNNDKCEYYCKWSQLTQNDQERIVRIAKYKDRQHQLDAALTKLEADRALAIANNDTVIACSAAAAAEGRAKESTQEVRDLNDTAQNQLARIDKQSVLLRDLPQIRRWAVMHIATRVLNAMTDARSKLVSINVRNPRDEGIKKEKIKKLDAWLRNDIFAWSGAHPHTWDDRRGTGTLWNLCVTISNNRPAKYDTLEPMQMFRFISKS